MLRIEGYRFGHVVVDGEEQTGDLIVLSDRVVTDWWRADEHRLALADLNAVIEDLPERLVVGTGAYGRMHPPDVVDQFRQHGVQTRPCRQQKRSAATGNSILAAPRRRCT